MRFEQFVEGAHFSSAPYDVTLEEIVEFADRYDPQDVHRDVEVAKSLGHDQVIAPGMLIISIAWKLWLATGALGSDGRGGLGLGDVRFMSPVHPGDTLRVEGTVSQARLTSKGKGLVTTDLVMYNQDDVQIARYSPVSMIAREGDA